MKSSDGHCLAGGLCGVLAKDSAGGSDRMAAQTQDGTDPGTAVLSPLHLASLESDSVGDFRNELSREGACLVSMPKALESPGFDGGACL